jgi:hypothetical protein
MGREEEREMEIHLSLKDVDAKEEEANENGTEEAAEAIAGEVDDDASLVQPSLQQNIMKTEEVYIYIPL